MALSAAATAGGGGSKGAVDLTLVNRTATQLLEAVLSALGECVATRACTRGNAYAMLMVHEAAPPLSSLIRLPSVPISLSFPTHI